MRLQNEGPAIAPAYFQLQSSNTVTADVAGAADFV
jgi:hypothetical protein